MHKAAVPAVMVGGVHDDEEAERVDCKGKREPSIVLVDDVACGMPLETFDQAMFDAAFGRSGDGGKGASRSRSGEGEWRDQRGGSNAGRADYTSTDTSTRDNLDSSHSIESFLDDGSRTRTPFRLNNDPYLYPTLSPNEKERLTVLW